MNAQGCNDPAKRENIGRLFEERVFDVLEVTVTKFMGRCLFNFGNLREKISCRKNWTS